nr:putative polyprotein [Tanacetum cinerariifolium]
MRMEQYLTFTDHALWEVIVNGDSVSSVTSASAEGPIPLKTAEQKLARKNKLKAKSTLMLAIPDEHLLKFHACKDTNTNETINTAHCVSAASSKDQASTASYAADVMFSFFSNQSNAPQLANEDLEHIDTNDLEEMDLKWQVVMLTMRVKRFIKKTGRKLDLDDKETVDFDSLKVKCYNYHRRGHFARECRALRNQENRNRDALTRNAPVDTSTTNDLVVQDGIAAVLTNSGQVPVNAAKQSSQRTTTSVSAVRHVNTAASKPNVNTAKVTNVATAGPKAVVSATEKNSNNVVKSSTCWIWRPKENLIDHISKDSGSYTLKRFNYVDPQGIFDSGCSRHMTGNKSYLIDYQEIDGGFVSFRGNAKGGKITRKGKIRTGKLDFEDVYFVKELKFNLFSVSQMCDKKNSVLFTDTEYVVLSPDFKLLDESQVLLKLPRNHNIYSFDFKNVVHVGGLTCLFSKATKDEYNLWHRRIGHINFKTMNKLVRGNLVRGLPSKLFENDHTCVACQKGKQHKASCIENQVDHKVKAIRCDNEAEFKNRIMNEFCEMKGIRREFSVAKTPQQNSVAGRINKTLIEAAKTILADFKLKLALSFMKPFGCPVTILNTLDHLGKFDGKSDDRFFVGYSINSKAFRVFNTRTKIGEENPHINFLENKTNVAGIGPNWMFDIDTLTVSMNYQPVFAGNQTNGNAGTKANIDVGQTRKNTEVPRKENGVQDPAKESDKNNQEKDLRDQEEALRKQFKQESERLFGQREATNTIMTNRLNTISSLVNTVSSPVNANTGIFSGLYDDEVEGAKFRLPKVWRLVDLPKGKHAIGTKWVYRNKKDERGVVVRNKARLVAQGYTQEEGINYDEVFAHVARIEAIRLFLACASFMGFIVYQMDIKSAFLYGTIEEVYVCQPPGFEDPHFPDKVYKVEKALYGLHQAPRAWYETLSTYLLENRFRRGIIDKNLFIKKEKGDILLVQVGELTFFLGLQVMQRDDGIFISQDKYVADILKKFDFSSVKTSSTPIETNKALLKDEEAKDVDVYLYRSIIGSLMYLTASRPDIMFAVCTCARFQVTPKVLHLHAMKRIFRYLKGQPKLGLWYPRDSPFDLEAFSNSDYARASLDRKSNNKRLSIS